MIFLLVISLAPKNPGFKSNSDLQLPVSMDLDEKNNNDYLVECTAW